MGYSIGIVLNITALFLALHLPSGYAQLMMTIFIPRMKHQ